MTTINSVRNFVFTCFKEESHLDDLKNWDQVTYLVYGREICPTTQKPHLQGYCELKGSKKFSNLQKKLPETHIEKRKGSAKDADVYCRKDGDIFEQGTISQQGRQTPLHDATDMIIDGASNREIAIEHPVVYVKYHRGLHAFRCAVIEPRTTQPRIIVLYGESGTGKSRTARDYLNPGYWCWTPMLEKWFCGYQGQDEVLFEEFRGQFPLGQLLTLLDRYDTKVQPKGLTSIEFVATKIVITSPVHPKYWYENLNTRQEGFLNQLLRRLEEFGKIIEVTKYEKPQADIRDFFSLV